MYDFDQLDAYELLGVARNASSEEIKRAYRQEIAKYHPDRWSKADSAEQEYARKRAAAITQAYSMVKSKGKAPAQPVEEPVPENRAERLAQLYERGRSLLNEGSYAQAAIVLRQLQQADPFYRDSADLLYRAEFAQKRERATPDKQRRGSKKVLWGALGLIGIAALGGAIYLFGGSKALVAEDTTPTAAAIAGGTAVASTEPADEETSVAEGPTLTPSAQAEPPTEAPPTDTPIPPTEVPPTDTVEAPTEVPPTEVPPTDTPIPPTEAPPTEVPTPGPPPVDDLNGPVLLADDLDGGTWPVGGNVNWNFSFENGRYRMTMQPGLGSVWAYSAALPGNSVVLSVDVDVRAGSAGLLMAFVDGNNHYRFLVGVDGTWAFQRKSAGQVALLASGSGLGTAGRLSIAQRGAVSHLYWNDTFLAEVGLPAFPAGSYGFTLVGTGSADAYFDTLRIRQLP